MDLEALKTAAEKVIETRMERVESKNAPKHVVVPKMIAHGKAVVELKRKATPEVILELVAFRKSFETVDRQRREQIYALQHTVQSYRK